MFDFLHSGNMQRSLAYIGVNCIQRNLSYICLVYFVVLSSCHNRVTICCGTLSYSLYFVFQTDQGDETEGLKMEGLEMEI